jgi:hypothetical protein
VPPNYHGEIAKLAPLEKFDVSAFIADDTATQGSCDFVLALAVVFNDIKDLVLAENLLLSVWPENATSATPECGSAAGLHLHFFRLLFGVLHELLNLIRQEAGAQANPMFRKVIRLLPKRQAKAWAALVTASKITTSADPDVKYLLLARNKVAYHYERKAIGQGYRRAFASTNETTFVSRGSSIETSRFYFADRAVQSYLQQIFGDNQLENYFLQKPKLIAEIAGALHAIVTKFVEGRGFAWNQAAD